MPRLIWNPLGHRWVAIAPGRNDRPGAAESDAAGGSVGDEPDHDPRARIDPDPDCPLCPGNEDRTPPETWALRPDGSDPDTEGWLVRCVPNLYPAVEGRGMAHEVLINSPSHLLGLSEMGFESVQRVTIGWQKRLASYLDESQTKFIQASVNSGRGAGASLAHPHSQLLALSFAPPVAKSEHRAFSEGCPICDLVDEAGGGLVAQCDEWMAVVPPWAELGYEVIAMPRLHERSFLDAETAPLAAAQMLDTIIGALADLLPNAPYNVILHTPARGTDSFHWHLHIYPRVSTFAGIELGAGIAVATIEPADAAAAYRRLIG